MFPSTTSCEDVRVPVDGGTPQYGITVRERPNPIEATARPMNHPSTYGGAATPAPLRECPESLRKKGIEQALERKGGGKKKGFQSQSLWNMRERPLGKA